MNATALPQAGSLEARLLLCCARLSLDGPALEEATNLLNQNPDFMALAQLAEQHRVLPLLSYALQKNPLPSIPQHHQQQLQQRAQQYAMQNMVLIKTLTEILTMLEAAQIRAIPFKGPILAIAAYNNLALRQIGDLDLLIHKNDMASATHLLMSKGYQRTVDVPWEIHLDSPDGRHNLDLHRDVVPQHLSCFSDDRTLWDSLAPMTLLGQTVHTFSPERLLFILCLNGTKENWCKLNRISDIAALVQTQSLDWPWIISQAKQQGAQRLIGIGLLLAHNLLAAPLPEFVLQWALRDRTTQTLAQQLQEALFSQPPAEVGEVERSLFHMRTRERLSDKLITLRGLLHHSGWLTPTQNDRNAFPLPAYLSFLYYAIRPFRVIQKYLR